MVSGQRFVKWMHNLNTLISPLSDPISTNPKRRRESPTRPLKLPKDVEPVIHAAENGAELSLRASAAAAHDVVYQSYYPGLQHDPQIHYSHQHAIENWPPEPQSEAERASAAAGGVLIVVSSNSALPKEDYNYSSPAIYTSPADVRDAFIHCPWTTN